MPDAIYVVIFVANLLNPSLKHLLFFWRLLRAGTAEHSSQHFVYWYRDSGKSLT